MCNVKEWRAVVVGTLVAVGAFGASRAFAGGIEVPMQGARAAAQADAFTAQADDPSAIFYNPAGLTQLRGTHVSAGLYFLQPEWRFEPDAGGRETMRLPTFLPHLYASTDFGLERWRFGIGVNNPFGINEDWGDTGALRLLVDDAQLMCINVAPTVAYKVNDNFSLGVAFNVYYGSVLLTRQAMLGPPPIPEGEFHFRGEAYAFGVTPGLLWKINEQHTIGAYYRSPFTFRFQGDAQVKLGGNPVAGPSGTDAELDFPQSIGIGYAFRPTESLKLEADVIWTDWNAVNEFAFESRNPAFDGQALRADWESGFTYRVGAEYRLDEHWALRAGYAYSENAIPNATFSAIVPDSDYHLVAAGFGYATGNWSFDLAAQFIHRMQRDVSGSVNSPLVDGEWSNDMWGVMATVTYKF